MLTLLVAPAILLAQSSAQGGGSEGNKQATVHLLAALRSALGRAGNVVIDLGAGEPRVPLDTATTDEIGLRSLAVRMGRVFERVSGTAILRMPRSEEPQHSDEMMAEVVSRLPQDILEAGMSTGLRFSDIPLGVRNQLIEIGALSPAAAQNIEANPDKTFIRFSVAAMAQIETAQGSRQVSIFTERSYIPTRLKNSRLKPFAADGASRIVRARTAEGPLKFDAGDIRTLTDVAELAGKTFGQIYTVDKRLKGERFYICGSYSMATFDEAFGKLTSVSPISRMRPTRASIVDAVCRRAMLTPQNLAEEPAGPDPQQLMSGRPLNADAFGQLSNQTKQLAAQMQLGADASVVLRPLFNITIDDGIPGALNKTIALKGY